MLEALSCLAKTGRQDVPVALLARQQESLQDFEFLPTVAPGLTETPLVAEWLASQDDPEAFRAKVASQVPQGRIGAPDEVAWAIAWLASDVSPHVTGAVIPIDGGYTAA